MAMYNKMWPKQQMELSWFCLSAQKFDDVAVLWWRFTGVSLDSSLQLEKGVVAITVYCEQAVMPEIDLYRATTALTGQ